MAPLTLRRDTGSRRYSQTPRQTVYSRTQRSQATLLTCVRSNGAERPQGHDGAIWASDQRFSRFINAARNRRSVTCDNLTFGLIRWPYTRFRLRLSRRAHAGDFFQMGTRRLSLYSC